MKGIYKKIFFPTWQMSGFVPFLNQRSIIWTKSLYRCLNNLLPESIFDDYIQPIGHRYSTYSKVNKKLYLRKTNTNYGKFDIKHAKVWNDIPLGIRTSSSLANFKKYFKEYIL